MMRTSKIENNASEAGGGVAPRWLVTSALGLLLLANCGQGNSSPPDGATGGASSSFGGSGGSMIGTSAGGSLGMGGSGVGGAVTSGGAVTTGGANAFGGSTASGGAGPVIGAGGNVGRGGSGSGGSNKGGASSSGGSTAGTAGSTMGSGGTTSTSKCGPVTAVPEAERTRLNLDPFYKKHVDANGVPVLASAAPSDESLILACELLLNMLGKRDDVRLELIRRKARFAIIGKDEGTADIPEYGYRDGPQEDIDYINQRARGLGGIVASCGEENILCLKGDRYYNESICVHEFSHTISTYGAYRVDSQFQATLTAAYQAALGSGILDQTYRNSNAQEYWAEGVQDWYSTNASSNPPNGVHNNVNTRAELATYDPTLHALIGTIFPEAVSWGDCHAPK